MCVFPHRSESEKGLKHNMCLWFTLCVSSSMKSKWNTAKQQLSPLSYYNCTRFLVFIVSTWSMFSYSSLTQIRIPKRWVSIYDERCPDTTVVFFPNVKSLKRKWKISCIRDVVVKTASPPGCHWLNVVYSRNNESYDDIDKVTVLSYHCGWVMFGSST